jgi:DNA-binding HxlR family transcriptional regulator
VPQTVEPSLAESEPRGNVLAKDCPSRNVLNHLTCRWGVLVLLVLKSGKHRFGELRRKIGGGLSERMLAETLQGLEADGFVLRTDYHELRPHVDYQLTGLGREAAEKVAALAGWIEDSMPRIIKHWNVLPPQQE